LEAFQAANSGSGPETLFIRLTIILQKRRNRNMGILAGRKVVIIGDRDGIPGQAIEACAKSAGAEVVFSSTECFV